MTYQVKFTSAYKRSYKLMKKRGLDVSLLDEVVDLLRQGKQLDEKYRNHGIIENDILTLTLVDTGSHADIFKK